MPRRSSSRFSTELASIIRAVLILVLGGKCEMCGGTLLSVLEIDHPNGRNWQPRDYNRLTRVLRYCDEHARGVRLRVLCRRCNAMDGAIKGNAWFAFNDTTTPEEDNDGNSESSVDFRQ